MSSLPKQSWAGSVYASVVAVAVAVAVAVILFDTVRLGEWLDNYGFPIPKKDQLPLAPSDESNLSAPAGHRYPLLVHMPDHDAPLLYAALILMAEQSSQVGVHHVAAVLAAQCTPDALARHLGTQLRVRLPGQTETTRFRFWDPRVMRVLFREFMPIRIRTLFGPVRIWAYMDFLDKLRVIENRNPVPGSTPPTLMPADVARLKLNPDVNRAMGFLQGHRALWTETLDLE
ncbi:MAG: DUF4123 domain-containing protein, partial [Azoarcus sp.]|nr:DUF4123 domain-containing protein [Azoarcus sp.]